MFRLIGMIVSLAACAALAYNWLPGKEITIQDAVSTSKDIVQTAQNYLEENIKSLPSKEKSSLVSAVEIEENSELDTMKAIPPKNPVSQAIVEETETITDQEPEQVYIFWGPFQSKSGAAGFAKKVKKITGQPAEVIVKSKKNYMVAFVGREADVQLSVSLFEQKTGMELTQKNI